MAKRKRVSSKQSTGTRRQRELLASSKCRTHNLPGITTINLPEGKYIHKCEVCIRTPQKVKVTKPTGGTLFKLLTGGR